ncbi:uncharacterized protein LOC100908670 [Galendromus occidentalis]|uniref:Uncharacterized protein LOC100908670 n=1 Tax=Galendromus occidentalis TaxID=34638 RepID=A0AAJ6QME6_9ACAR|nr:uncharacterized protein LOC100908670 [Galendromus occidentalis]
MPGREEEKPKTLQLFKSELASVLENNAAKLLENHSEQTDLASSSKLSQKKASQISLARLFNSGSPSTLTVHSGKSDTAERSSELRISTESQDRNGNRKTSNAAQVGMRDFPKSRSVSSSDTEDSDIEYSKFSSKERSRFFVALPAKTKHRPKTPLQTEASVPDTAVKPESEENTGTGGTEFVRNVIGFGAQIRKSFFRRKVQRSEEKLGPLKQIRSDDDSSDSEAEDVTIFMPRLAKASHAQPGVPETTPSSHHSDGGPELRSEALMKKTKKSGFFFRKNNNQKTEKDCKLPSNSATEAVQLRGGDSSTKCGGCEVVSGEEKSESRFYVNAEIIPNRASEDTDSQGNGLRQYFEEALATEDSARGPKRRHLSWFTRKRKSERPAVVAAAVKSCTDIGTQFPEVEEPDVSPEDPDTEAHRAMLERTSISQELLWKVPRETAEIKEQDVRGVMFQCSSSHNEFPVHESDYVPGDSELTLSSLDVTDKVNVVSPPTYYGSNPKPARIPIFSACCPAKATDLSVPYVKSAIEGAESRPQKVLREREARELNPAMAIVKTVAKQVVVKLRERERRKKKTEAIFYPKTYSTSLQGDTELSLALERVMVNIMIQAFILDLLEIGSKVIYIV